ncbi:YihA family ribosome biogenesis GTP-binding protein [Mycoplasmopsis mucosicanis]|uniref:Probable GTP-binding protein EngB n=1 Tax=Mycoplasmopsis mucosicanis TaxID=458208 RepID=A0A507SVE3_9BACT|nr:ribosome biogenesis GTP-binding protein YihA/YsxC [Mycoplasmopsis mucosicanis]TQC54155.1 YihA family ribosome biogenesis GTP-binding protein [Mycoplasmopsis mucosicanis]
MWKFITSSLEPSTWHNTQNNQQIVFWGRSNVGKSSLLNALTSQNLAFVSKRPGRTQLINFFADNNNKYIVDLPGYGYAEMSKTQQEKMLKNIKMFLSNDPNPKHIFILLDSRSGITKIDLEILNFISQLQWNYSLIYTKIDKLNQKEKSALIKKHTEFLENYSLGTNINTFLVSAQKRINLDELVSFVDQLLYSN